MALPDQIKKLFKELSEEQQQSLLRDLSHQQEPEGF